MTKAERDQWADQLADGLRYAAMARGLAPMSQSALDYFADVWEE